MSVNWPAYLKASRTKPLHPLWDEIDKYLPTEGVALELGCGAGAAVEHLVHKGLSVIAVDQEPDALQLTRERVGEDAPVHFVKAQFQDLGLDTNSLDVVSASFSLFFLRPWEFGQVWQRLLGSLKDQGLFAGQFLGVNDDWAARGYTVYNLNEVQAILNRFEILHLQEVEEDGTTTLGDEKHWHVFHVVARKRPAEQLDA